MKKVLHVEDDVLLAKMYVRRLSREGIEVTIAGDGQEALDLLEKGFRPDLILLDIMMPRMNGFQLLEKLGAEERYKRIPVIILTNLLEDKESEQKAKEFGVKEYFVKSGATLDDVTKSIIKVIQENPRVSDNDGGKGLWRYYG